MQGGGMLCGDGDARPLAPVYTGYVPIWESVLLAFPLFFNLS